ncbi:MULTISPECIES: ABC transporter ATP-binding protein [Clostridium]|uniref:ABC transporter ATP-binding protein n=1 Tax=Clostridium cadaveris TaxID=1529 RepID=A0A1I2MIG4_9CLOT|nr:ABC transporter ATP-binding protein [Clostridium cadaveris]MDU4952697.1 ABC transporter ATP-binding protein [Clostridium sp.]MDM8311798.1 ABC transporter ATP-binding protein [Clostridium cadaveris]MDY4950203.1 ABC transporter ATP-binding protein [Clostridium cadaveris]NME64907.1 ABC transporter ATP-binding protein [Clostridium cadaveris]PWL53914.1 MAG: ABC transporter ATP-binding protein [Clostridium cadaveris]
MISFISFNNVYKRYKMGEVIITAADGISFEANQGELSIIVGPSGAGKSTVLNILGGIDKCDDGEIFIGGKELGIMDNGDLTIYRRDDIGFVFQFYNLIPNLTAKENVEIAAQICKNPMNAEEALRSVGLEDRMDHFPSQLSGGEQQRVAIARALAKRPKLLLCDEPTGALDYKTGKNILKLLQETCQNEGMTVVLVTHNQALTPMANRVIKLKSSKVESIITNEYPTSIDDIEW